MSESSKSSKKKGQSQKIVIPRGTINPNETTVVEIPADMRKKPMIIAKGPHSVESATKKKDKTKKHRDRSQVTTKTEQKRITFNNPASNTQESGHKGHSSYVNYANPTDIEKLLEELEQYYCSQRKILMKAKLSAVSNCSCNSEKKIHVCAQTDSGFDLSTFRHSSIEKPYTSAPVSHVSIGIEPESIVKIPCFHNQSFGKSVESKPSCCSIPCQSKAPVNFQPSCCSTMIKEPVQTKSSCCNAQNNESNVSLLTPHDLEQIRMQFEEASSKLQEILNQTNQPSTSGKSKKKFFK